VKGRIAPQLLADLVVLDGNPLALPPARIKDIRVALTVLGGRVVYER
jgi:predicted amidohydrolase YtcJ